MTDSDDPRLAAVRKALSRADSQLADKAKNKATRTSRGPLGWIRDHAPHWLLLSISFTLAGLAVVWCYYLLNVMLTAGRAVAIPTGMLCAVVASYASMYLQSAVQASFEQGELGRMPLLDWQDWFWTLPSTVGMLGLAALASYFLSWLSPPHRLWIVTGAASLLYPFLQLSVLESGAPLEPLSRQVAINTVRHPVAWLVFLCAQSVIAGTVVVVARTFWRDPPFLTVAILGPVLAAGLVLYAWCLGRLARQFRNRT